MRSPCSTPLPLPLFVAVVSFAAGAAVQPVAAQRPTTATAALAAFAEVADRAEGERRRAVAGLGDFAEDEVTAVLLRELAVATEIGYRQDLLRALGRQSRPTAVPGLAAAIAHDTNPRLLETAAAALANQGEAGAAALIAVVDAPAPTGPGAARMRRTAALTGLGASPVAAAVERLLREARQAAGRDRLPALRALADRREEAGVDAVRTELAVDRDLAVAAAALSQLARHRHREAPALAMALHQRGQALDTEAHTAIAEGLLVAADLEPVSFAPLLQHAAAGDDPLAIARRDDWDRRLAAVAFARFLVGQGVFARAAAERELAARLLGRLPAQHAHQAWAGLDVLLATDDAAVGASVVAAVQQLGGDGARSRLESLVARGGDATAPSALAALRELAPDPAALLLAHVGARSPLLRAAALEQLAGLPSPPAAATTACVESLGHARWQVRAAAIRLARTLRSRDLVPPLIECLDDRELRLAADARAALRDLTGRDLGAIAAWRSWWQQEGKAFQPLDRAVRPAAPAREAATVTYWNLPVVSDRIAFVVDTSGSMNQPFGTGGGTRLVEAQRQLERAVGQLPARARCNLIAFADTARAFAPTLQPTDAKRRAALLAMGKALTARGPTDVHAALQLAFADPEVDTIYLLTDGHPSAGAIVDASALAAQVRRWNVGRGVVVHTIALGGKSDFLAQLARESGGEHTVAR